MCLAVHPCVPQNACTKLCCIHTGIQRGALLNHAVNLDTAIVVQGTDFLSLLIGLCGGIQTISRYRTISPNDSWKMGRMRALNRTTRYRNQSGPTAATSDQLTHRSQAREKPRQCCEVQIKTANRDEATLPNSRHGVMCHNKFPLLYDETLL